MPLGNMSAHRVFLSGPMTGKPDWNRAQFNDAERKLRSLGAEVVFNPAKLAPSGTVKPARHADYMRETLHELTASSDTRSGRSRNQRHLYYDVIVMLPGWKKSVGARLEMAVAQAIGMEVIEL